MPESADRHDPASAGALVEDRLDAAEQILTRLREALDAEVDARVAFEVWISSSLKNFDGEKGILRHRAPLEQSRAPAKQVTTEVVENGRPKTGITFMFTVMHDKIKSLTENFADYKTLSELKAKQCAKIDDCSMRDTLTEFYHLLSRAINAGDTEDETEILKAGPFEGNVDELWSLRERVLRRLATFDAYGVALNAVGKVDVDV